MPFEIVRNDIVNMQVDVVVNTANPNPVIGSGVDSGIHHFEICHMCLKKLFV